MDPVIVAIIAALSAGATSGASDVAKKAIVDGYQALMAVVKKKLGNNSAALGAIDKLEENSESPTRQEVLAEQLKASNVAGDLKILRSAQLLLQLVKALPHGEQHIQQVAHGTGIAQAGGGGTATVSISGLPAKKNND